MREILFRGKRTNDYEWIEGSLCTTIDFYTISYFDFEGYYIEEKVIPETVGQYIGLTDKNGKKVFEGDIISIPFEEDRYPYEENVIYYENAEVYFDTERYGWYVRYSDDDSLSIWEYDDCDIFVIGNIHDNPKLLKGDEN